MPYNVLKYSFVDDEIEDVIVYYESISYELGLRVEQEIIRALNKLAHNPHHYFVLSDKIHRRIVIEDFPYMFVYSINGDNVIVKILFPQKDDPAKLWKRLVGG